MWINPDGQLYEGDCAAGDREATPQEISEWELSRAPTKKQQIDALLGRYGIAQEWQLDRDMGLAVSIAQLAGVTEQQLYAGNATYHLQKDIKTQIEAIRSAP